jgi:hypothetical protein
MNYWWIHLKLTRLRRMVFHPLCYEKTEMREKMSNLLG